MKERTKFDNATLPPFLKREVRRDRLRVSKSSASGGRDVYMGSKVVQFIKSNREAVFSVALMVFAAVLGIDIAERAWQVKQEGIFAANRVEADRAAAVAADLAKYNAEELRVQAEVNKGLQTALLSRNCK
jgi:hypothetical protein